MKLSEKDQEIIRILLDDARSSIKKIAKKVKMSQNGVRYRLDKLEEQGIIVGYTTEIDAEKIGRSMGVVFFIKPTQGIEIDHFMEVLSGIEQLYSVLYITGDHPFIALGSFTNKDELMNFIEDNLVSSSDIKDYDYKMILDESSTGGIGNVLVEMGFPAEVS